MTQYMLSVHHVGAPENALLEGEEQQLVIGQVEAFNQKLQDSGAWVFAGGLQGPEATTTVDARSGDTIVTDGPHAETKEYLGGFWVVEAADLSAATSLAEEASVACREEIRVRPFQSV